jgi:RNA polymerase sigma-70 factor (ECF subfamily)
MGDLSTGERQAAVGPLLAEVRKGDVKAFERLVKSYWEPVMLYFWKRANAADAEDLTQDVFLAIYRAVRNGDGPVETDPVSWRRYLFACARHRLGGYWQRRSREPRSASFEDLLGDDDLSWEAVVSRDGADRSAADRLVSREESDAVRDCLGQIDAAERSICWLIFGEGKSKRQVAASIGVPESSLRDRLVGVLRELRRCLQGKGVEVALS